jgi:uncharacterized protein YjbI with pentapeptide repeats
MLSMANDEHVALLKQGVAAWNAWRVENRNVRADLSQAPLAMVVGNLEGADLDGADLSGSDLNWTGLREAVLTLADLRGADLRGADLSKANLGAADLRGANLRGAHLVEADLRVADLSGAKLGRAHLGGANLGGAKLGGAKLGGANLKQANLRGADLSKADLRVANLAEADLSRANLRGANLSMAALHLAKLIRTDLSGAKLIEAKLYGATLLQAELSGADLTGCRIFGTSAWGLKLERTKQQNLVITHANEPEITVDDIEVAQFIYMMLHNEKIRDVIDTIGKKGVLLLGRFTDKRKAVLDALREELRKRNYLPILFDFNVPATRDITETVSLLARMARFIIADLTRPSSIPKELEAIVPNLAVPVQPLLEGASRPYAMFKDYWKYDWVLPVYRYEGLEQLLATLAEDVIAPAEKKVKALQERRRVFEAELTKPR